MSSDLNAIKGQETGNLISEELSSYLKLYTTIAERHKIAERFEDVSGDTLHAIAARRRNVTEKNAPALAALLQVAIMNCHAASKQAEEAETFLKNLVTS